MDWSGGGRWKWEVACSSAALKSWLAADGTGAEEQQKPAAWKATAGGLTRQWESTTCAPSCSDYWVHHKHAGNCGRKATRAVTGDRSTKNEFHRSTPGDPGNWLAGLAGRTGVAYLIGNNAAPDEPDFRF